MGSLFLDPLRVEDTDDLMRFEAENRAWFERWVGPRPETYWDRDALYDLIVAQTANDDLMYLIRPAPSGEILGRLNLTDFTDGVGQIGYRVGQKHCGRGLATQAVGRAVDIARKVGLWALEARVADKNPASKQVLLRNGFSFDTSQAPKTFQDANGVSHGLTILRLLLD